jgi:DoxX-like family
MHTVTKRQLWVGRILSGIPVLFLLMDGVGKLVAPPPVLEGTAQLGWPVGVLGTLGVLVLAGVLLYVVPRTSLLGAIWLTGFLGGAVATHVRVGNPLFSHVLFPTYLAAMLWAGLVLRDGRLRALLPFTSARPSVTGETPERAAAARLAAH